MLQWRYRIRRGGRERQPQEITKKKLIGETMDLSVNLTRKLCQDILTVLANASFANPQELVQSASTPSGSTLEDLIDSAIKELEYATSKTVYTQRATL